MNITITKSPRTNLTTLLHTCLLVIALTALSGCGKKGPLILEQVPVKATQTTVENDAEQVPVVAPAATPDEPQKAPKTD